MSIALKNIRFNLDPVLVTKSVKSKLAEFEDYRVRKLTEEKLAHKAYALALEEGTAQDWSNPRTDLAKDLQVIEDRYFKFIDEEKNSHSKVRVVRVHEGVDFAKSYESYTCYHEGRFVLVYGDIDDQDVTHGTGPFVDVEEAGKWFFGAGR